MKVKDMEVWCVEQQEINTIQYFADKLGLKKIYNIKDVLNNPNKTAGGCHTPSETGTVLSNGSATFGSMLSADSWLSGKVFR